MTNKNITVIGADKFQFSRGFKMPNDDQTADPSKDWINWGKDNLAPNFYNHILYSSAFQSGIIRGKMNYLIGSGFQISTGSEEQLNGIFGSYSAQDILEGMFFDFENYNAFAIRVMRSMKGGKTYEHIDFDQLRSSKEGSGWWYSNDWSDPKQDPVKTGLKFYPNYEDGSEDFDSIYVYTAQTKSRIIKKNTKKLLNVYPTPIWIGALKSLMTDIEIQSFHLHNIINGMKVSGVLNFANGEPEDKRSFENQVQDAITPTENAGGILINYSDGDDRKPSFIPFSGDDLDKRYMMLEKSMIQNIMTAHCITSPSLFGIKTEGQLGQSTELETSFEIFKRTYIRGRQKIVEEHFNYLMDGVTIEINEPEPLFSNIQKEEVVDEEIEVKEKFAKEQSIEDKVISELSRCGRPKSEFKMLRKNLVNEGFDFDNSAQKLKDEFLGSKFAISDLDSKVLDLVRRGEGLGSIVEALEDDKKDVQKSYNRMVKDGLILDGDISEQGVKELAQNQPDFDTEILYSYEKRPDVTGKEIIDGTRDFCRIIIDLKRLYTRQEIESISATVDRNVWLYRGGWYNDPNKDRPTPFCRHIWSQNLTINRR